MKIIRSAAAIVASLAAVIVLSMGTDWLMVRVGYFPPLEQYDSFSTETLVVATLYRALYAVAGGYVAAGLAPSRPMLHALVLGALGFALALLGAILMWHMGRHWYPLALVLMAVPCSVLGGRLAGAKL